MIRELKEVYVRSGRYALLCPLLFAIPVVVEMIQHAAEIATGFYDGREQMIAAERHPLRMVLGHAKVIALFLVGYWAARFLVFGDDARAARRLDPKAVRLFVPVMAWGLFWLVALQDGPILAEAMGVDSRTMGFAFLAVMVVSMAFEPCLSTWKTAAAAGNPDIGFVRSIRLTRGAYWWALGFSMLVMLPLMIAHYALSFSAVGQARGLVWAIMALDSLLVGFMIVAMIAGSYVVARRVTARHGIALGGDAEMRHATTSAPVRA